MTPVGKIARLPEAIREQLNRRLRGGEPGRRLVAWLNRLPETRQVLAAEFGGRPVNEPNLTAWKAGGYQVWLAQKEILEQAREPAPDPSQRPADVNGRLTDHLATLLAARYAVTLAKLDGDASTELPRQLRVLHDLCQSIVRLRRGDLQSARLNWQQTCWSETAENQGN
jgi:hypothetical protein